MMSIDTVPDSGGRMIKAKITEAEIMSDYEEIKEFKDYNELVKYMKDEFHSWVIEWSWYKSGESEADVSVIKYNDYLE